MAYDYTKLKSLRSERGLSQKDMGELLGITQSAYNKLEKGNRKRKTDSIVDIEKLAEILHLTAPRLISILTNQENIRASGIKESDLWQIQQITKNNPLREDEFILFTTEVMELEKYDFKEKYSGVNLHDYDENLCRIDNGKPLPIWEYPPTINIILAEAVQIGFDFENKELKQLSVWIGNKKLGVIREHRINLIDQLITSSLISRVIMIENEDQIAGYFETYMKLVFIASNAVCKSCEFKEGRFVSMRLLTEDEIKNIDEEARDSF